MSSDNEDKTDPESGVSSLNRAGRACGNTRTTRGCLHPTRKAMRKIREGEAPLWGLRLEATEMTIQESSSPVCSILVIKEEVLQIVISYISTHTEGKPQMEAGPRTN